MDRQVLKYGENPHQNCASLNIIESDDPLALGNFNLLEGTPLGMVNVTDLDRLVETMTRIAAGFETNVGSVPAIAIGVKHGNACGAAYSWDNHVGAVDAMMKGDSKAIFGGFIMVNFRITEDVAERIVNCLGGKPILDGIVVPEITEEAKRYLRRKNLGHRFIVNEALASLGKHSLAPGSVMRPVRGGFIRQDRSTYVPNFAADYVSEYGDANFRERTEINQDMILAWGIGSSSNSNTITLVREGMLVGNGAGQQSRVGAAMLAVMRAKESGHELRDVIAYSDSFFPFPDGPEYLADNGVVAILTSSGSMNDKKTIALCQERDVFLRMIPDKVCRGFFQH